MSKLCILPWVSIETSPIGEVKPCCLAKEAIPNVDLNASTLEGAFNSDYMRNLRQQFIDGEQPKTCDRCWNEESSGRTSKRMNSLLRLRETMETVDVDFTSTEGKLIFLDLKLGNICNLKCRICGSFSSSKWAQEEIEIQKEWPLEYKTNGPHEHLRKGQWPRKNQKFWDDMDKLLPYIRYFEFTGGEPFLINEHFELLRRAVDQGYSKNIEIHYNTNGTTFPKEGIELWPNFKLVEIAFSIDDVGDRFEYQRFGAKWNEVNDNISTFQELKRNNSNIKLQHCLTVNVFNIYYLRDLFQWMQQQTFDSTYFNVLHDAPYFSIRSLPNTAKQEIVEIYQENLYYKEEVDNLMSFMQQGTSTDGSDLRRVTDESDRQRKCRLTDHHRELAKAIGYE